MRMLIAYQFLGPYHRARLEVLRRRGVSVGVEVVALEVFSHSDLYRWPRGEELNGVVALGLRTNGRDGIRWRHAARLGRALRETKPDVVFVNGWGTVDAVVLHVMCAIRGVPRVVVSDSQESESRGALRALIKRAIVRGCASAFVGGKPHRHYVQRLGMPPEAIFEGCDVVDNAHFATRVATRALGGCRILTIARLVPPKNLLAAGRAFLDFVKTRPAEEGWNWSIVGYGPLQEELSRLASESDGRIRLLGPKAYDVMPQIFAEADLYWQPSIREPWGLAVNEAMASGLPVLVSSRCGCQEDLVTSQTGWTFDPFDKGAMVDALNRAALDRIRWGEMGQAATELVRRWGLNAFADGALRAAHYALRSRRFRGPTGGD